MASLGRPPAGCAWAKLVTASATPAMGSHRVKFSKLKPISNHQVTSLDNTRQK
jgi:hypothetical protein